MLNGNSFLLQEAEAGDLVNAIESHNVEGEKEMEDSSHHPTSSIMTVLRPDSPLVGATDDLREEEEGIQEVKEMEDSSHHPTSSIMTVLRSDSPLVGATDNSR